MDFLGLRTLTVLGKAVALLQQSGHDISLETIPLDDPAAYDLLRRGETTGVFQLEAGTTTHMTVDVAPDTFEDLIALMALIRPGPMEMAPDYISRKHGRTPIDYMHPDMEPILRETYGVALYQEQVMRIANVLAGFSMSEGDGLRKAMGKKLPEEMAKYRDRFVSGCIDRGIARRLADEIFAMIERFAGYGFNKAHSAAYAVIAAQTAYLKANFPVEFMAALMSSEIGNTDRIVGLMAECRRAGIAVRPPSINRSDVEFGVETEDDGEKVVRFALAAVKNVGEGAVRSIVACRAEHAGGRFANLSSLCDAIDWSLINRRAVESLAKAGALDELGSRGGILAALDGAIAAAQKRQRASARGQMDLFGGATPADTAPVSVDDAEVSRQQLLAWEKELLGTYMSDHPLSDILKRWQRTANGQRSCEIAQLENRGVNTTVRLLAMVAAIRRIQTKTDRTMAVATIEDLSGRIEVVVFPDAFERYSSLLTDGSILEVQGKLDRRGESLQIVSETFSADIALGESGPEARDMVAVRFSFCPDPWADIRAMQRVDEILRRHEGSSPVVLEIPAAAGRWRVLRSRSHRAEWSPQLESELLSVPGVAGVSLQALELERIAS
jgi:DNA polymerase III subunit alpha